MSRLFDGVDDFVTFAAGGLATAQNGAWTLAYAVRINDNHRGGIYDASQSSTRRFGVNPFDDNVFVAVAGVATVNASYVDIIDAWAILAFTKAAGSAQVRMHTGILVDEDPDNDVWDHADIGLIGGNGSGTADHFKIGKFDEGQFSPMNLAVFGGWTGTALSDGSVETLRAGGAAWTDLAPTALLDFHGDPGDPIADIMISGANQSDITGTTDAPGDDPPGFSYDFELEPPGPPSEGSTVIRMFLRATGHGVRESKGATEFGLRLTLSATGEGVSPPSVRRPARLVARGRTPQLVARGGYVNA